MQRGIDDPADFERTGREGKDILFSQLELEKPLICALTGHATGLGASLALVCDVVIAAVGALQAIRWTKVTVNLPLKALVHAHFDAGLAHELLSNRSADHAKAVAAFRERRPPRFSGR